MFLKKSKCCSCLFNCQWKHKYLNFLQWIVICRNQPFETFSTSFFLSPLKVDNADLKIHRVLSSQYNLPLKFVFSLKSNLLFSHLSKQTFFLLIIRTSSKQKAVIIWNLRYISHVKLNSILSSLVWWAIDWTFSLPKITN